MQYHYNFSLKKYNTFGIDAKAEKFVSVTNLEELRSVLKENSDVFILGGGSNILLTGNIKKTVIHLNLKGISAKQTTKNSVEVTAAAGENWHEFVLWCIHQNFGGIENLSLIPGNIGTCPIQNIGAYGCEVKDTIVCVQALNIETLEIQMFSNSDCKFGYRNSIFKNEVKDKYIITEVTFKLTQKEHNINTSYGAIKAELNNHKSPSLKEVSNAVITIRNKKLPDPKKIGNSGSFFKNPVVSVDLFKSIQKRHTEIPSYPVSETLVKIPAGWLIEKSGFKGLRFGEAGIHNEQALVLVNYGNATGEEIYEVAKKIQNKIRKEFDIALEIEVNII